MHWKSTFFLFCMFGILKKFDPGSPFLTQFLVANKNLTNAQVNGQVLPYSIYSNLFFSLPIFCSVDLLRYKPLLIVQSLCILLASILLVFGNGLFPIQLSQFFNGLATASDIGYAVYLYAIVDKKRYIMATSFKNGLTMAGQFIAFSLGQLLVIMEIGDYSLLNQLHLASSAFLLPISFLLPMPNRPERKQSNCPFQTANNFGADERTKLLAKMGDGQTNLMKTIGNNEFGAFDVYSLSFSRPKQFQLASKLWHFFETNVFIHFRNNFVLQWSIWIFLLNSIAFQAFSYIQTLWALSQLADGGPVWNGLVEGLNTLFGSICIFSLQFVKIQWEQFSLRFFLINSILFSFLLASMLICPFIYFNYFLYILMHSIFQLNVTIAVNVVATHLTTGKFGFVFGLALIFGAFGRSLLTFLIVDVNGFFALSVQHQFLAYCSLFLCAPLIFIFMDSIKYFE